EVICAVPPAGHGSVSTAHGPLPLPAPAVLEIARSRSIPLRTSEGFPAGELTTPTGLALAACWATRFGVMPTAVPLRLGVGLGSRSLDRPNQLRLCLARPLAPPLAGAPEAAAEAGGDGESAEPLLEQQAQIDDASAEDLAFLAEALRQAGAVEVFSQTALMKKGRAGTLITALLPPALAPALRQVWWRHSGSLGVRETLQRRWRLPRRLERLSTELGTVGLRWVDLPDGRRRMKAEHDDLASLARLHGLEIAQVRQRVAEALARPAASRWRRPAAAPRPGRRGVRRGPSGPDPGTAGVGAGRGGVGAWGVSWPLVASGFAAGQRLGHPLPHLGDLQAMQTRQGRQVVVFGLHPSPPVRQVHP
ncbi:MAG: LarC family nickel insertion protein, partial [Cyanobium sp.]